MCRIKSSSKQLYSDTVYPIDRLLGTYNFVSMMDEDDIKLCMGEANPGSLYLFVPVGQEVTYDNICGVFLAANNWSRGTFRGLSPTQTRNRPNLMRFNLITQHNVIKEGHGLDITEALDSNGNNYISMMLEYWNMDSNCISYRGKKNVGGNPLGLSLAEKEKLGINLTFEAVEQRGRTTANH